jgi:hypothetical protein
LQPGEQNVHVIPNDQREPLLPPLLAEQQVLLNGELGENIRFSGRM